MKLISEAFIPIGRKLRPSVLKSFFGRILQNPLPIVVTWRHVRTIRWMYKNHQNELSSHLASHDSISLLLT